MVNKTSRDRYATPLIREISLIGLLMRANHMYYNTGTEMMKDEAFDALRQELKDLRPDHPLLKAVGAPIDEATELALWQEICQYYLVIKYTPPAPKPEALEDIF